jgi:hypothetical protein
MHYEVHFKVMSSLLKAHFMSLTKAFRFPSNITGYVVQFMLDITRWPRRYLGAGSQKILSFRCPQK